MYIFSVPLGQHWKDFYKHITYTEMFPSRENGGYEIMNAMVHHLATEDIIRVGEYLGGGAIAACQGHIYPEDFLGLSGRRRSIWLAETSQPWSSQPLLALEIKLCWKLTSVTVVHFH